MKAKEPAMHNGLQRLRLAAALLGICLAALCPRLAAAHALYAADTLRDGVVLVQFAYSTGEKPTYAKVEVYSPADDRLEYQNGRTDANGRFAFLPDAPGTWRIIMADNMGHRVEHPVTVGKPSDSATPDASAALGGFSMPLRILLGLSLLANAALCASLLRRRKTLR